MRKFAMAIVVGLLFVGGAKAESVAQKMQVAAKQCDTKKDAEACYQVGLFNQNGLGITKDYKKAAEYYQKACDMGILLGCDKIGMMYELGEGFKQDYKKAIKIYERTCSLKDVAGCFALGRLYREGTGVEQNISTAREYFQNACDYGEQDGCEMANALYDIQAEQELRELKKDVERCNNGDTSVCKKLIQVLEFMCPSSSYFCYIKGIVYISNNRDIQDYYKAREYFQKACDDEFAAACVNLGILYARGEGVRQNLSTAKEYFGKGCDFGEQEGCKRYKLLNQKGF